MFFDEMWKIEISKFEKSKKLNDYESFSGMYYLKGSFKNFRDSLQDSLQGFF